MASFLAFMVALHFAASILGDGPVSIRDGADASAWAEPQLPGSVQVDEVQVSRQSTKLLDEIPICSVRTLHTH